MPRQVTSSIAERGPVLEVVDGEPETRLRNQVELRARAEVVKRRCHRPDPQRILYIKNVVLFEDNSILLLPESLESSEW